MIAFNRGGGRPLGQRDDIDKLAILAHESGDPSIKRFFSTLPSLEELKRAKVESELKRVPETTTPLKPRGPEPAAILKPEAEK